jgi:hypothetical protein
VRVRTLAHLLSKTTLLLTTYPPLTLSGTGQGIFILLSLLDQILSAEFFSKISKLLWR